MWCKRSCGCAGDSKQVQAEPKPAEDTEPKQDMKIMYVQEVPPEDQQEKGVVYVEVRPKEISSIDPNAETGKDADPDNSYKKQG